MSWQDVTRSSLCSGVKGCETKRVTRLSLSQILFQNPKNYSLGDVQRFSYHSWCDMTVILDKISNSNNVYLSSSRFWTATSLVTFYHSLLCRNPEYHLKSLIGSEPHSHRPFAPILVFLVQTDCLWNIILWQLSVPFRHPWRIKKTDFTRQVNKTCTLLKINETRCVNRCWLIEL